MKTAIYIRVSTNEQDCDNQLAILESWCEDHGHHITRIYKDISSGKNSHHERRGFYKLLEDARKRKFELISFYALDRISREGTLRTLTYLDLFRSLQIEFHSFTEPYISTLGPFSDAVISILSTLAKIEREKISKRTKAGLQKARNKGKKLGRPPTVIHMHQEIKALRKQGYSYRRIAKQLKIGVTSVGRTLHNLSQRTYHHTG